jgi:pimeloyl-ACP methyl ester carboxylesterase
VHVRIARAGSLEEQLSTGKPTLLIMHQSPLSSRRYRFALDLLAEFCVPVAIDTPGYGASERDDADWSVDDYANTAWLVADMLGLERPWLFGRATGAVYMLHAAAQRPGAAAGIVLHGVPIYSDDEKRQRLAEFAPPYVLDSDGSHLAWIWSRASGEYPWAEPALITEFVKDYLAAGPDFASSYRAIWRHDLLESARRAGEVDLLIGGTRDRIFYMHKRSLTALQHKHAVVLEGATDFVAEQDPARFAATLRSVIAPDAE